MSTCLSTWGIPPTISSAVPSSLNRAKCQGSSERSNISRWIRPAELLTRVIQFVSLDSIALSVSQILLNTLSCNALRLLVPKSDKHTNRIMPPFQFPCKKLYSSCCPVPPLFPLFLCATNKSNFSFANALPTNSNRPNLHRCSYFMF